MSKGNVWLRRVGEGVVIVVSILLAFGIQAWWDARKEQEDERRILTALLEGARGNADWLDRMVPHYKARLNAVQTLQGAAAQTPVAISRGSLDALLFTVTGTFSPPLERGALDAALAGGRLDLIADEELRVRVAGWERGFQNADAQAQNDVRVDVEVWRPLLSRLGSLPEIAAHEGPEMVAKFGLPLPPGAFGKPPLAERVDHRPLRQQRENLNALQEKRWAYEDGLYNHANMVRPELDRLIRSFEGRLGLSQAEFEVPEGGQPSVK